MARSRAWRWGWLLVLAGLVVLPGTGLILHLAYGALHRSFGMALDLASIGLVLVLIIGFFAPLEAMGWWAGWFGEEMGPADNIGQLATTASTDRIRRWVVYLDGIGQSSLEAQPEGEDFLRRLAATLPGDIAIIRGIMPYSVVNQPMTEGGWEATFWRWMDWLRLRHPRTLLGAIINLRNLAVVAVSADPRYGPIYNRGTAKVIADSLVANGYPLASRTPVTLMGFSGGGQISLGALPHLRRLLQAPVEVISLAGVFSGGNAFLEADHLFHLVGDLDPIERIGPVVFPGRWRCLALSYWNRARRRGKVSLISLGAVGHELPGGVFESHATMNDGRTPMQQTVDLVSAILSGRLGGSPPPVTRESNYERFRTNLWHQIVPGRDTLPLPSAALRPLDDWIGRLVLPEPQHRDAGVGFEVLHAPDPWSSLVGRRVRLDWTARPLRSLAMDVHLSDGAWASWERGGIHPLRLDGWRQVTPLESLAGSRPQDDQLVRLRGPVDVHQDPLGVGLQVQAEPLQTTGLALALVRFIGPLGQDRWQVRPFSRERRRFDGEPFVVRLPTPVAYVGGQLPATAEGIERSRPNDDGWYVSGVPDGEGAFVVQSLVPRTMIRFAPERILPAPREGWRYAKREAWHQPLAGTTSSVLISGRRARPEDLLAEWQAGDRVLVLHVFGGIGGEQQESGLVFGRSLGHFAYGVADLEIEPLSGELSVAVQYRQVYAHNPEGLIAGAHDRWRYLGDRQWGWQGLRPVAEILVRFPPFTSPYSIGNQERSPLDGFEGHLAAMMARYRVGDGTGATFVGPANNCSQDSNQALFAALRQLQAEIAGLDPPVLREWQRRHPDQARRLEALGRFEKELRQVLLPFGGLREDWREQEYVLGSSLEDRPLNNLLRGLGSWRTLLPRLASDTVLRVFLNHGASALVLRCNQVGGDHPTIKPVAPMTL